MAEEQQLDIELQQNAEVEAELQQEIVMDVEEYSIHDSEKMESESGKEVNLINLVTIIDPEIVKSRKHKNKNILHKSNGFAKRFVNKNKVITNRRESILSEIAQSKKVKSCSKSKQDEIYTQIFEKK